MMGPTKQPQIFKRGRPAPNHRRYVINLNLKLESAAELNDFTDPLEKGPLRDEL